MAMCWNPTHDPAVLSGRAGEDFCTRMQQLQGYKDSRLVLCSMKSWRRTERGERVDEGLGAVDALVALVVEQGVGGGAAVAHGQDILQRTGGGRKGQTSNRPDSWLAILKSKVRPTHF